MSSSPSLASTTTSSASTPSSTQSTDSTTDATLYLYTFLATLVLLLAVSSAIVIRSLMLRRRHQRLVEEAIRTGTWLPHRFDSAATRRRRDVGKKPTLWEAQVNHDSDGDGDVGECDEKQRWKDINPVYAAYVHSPPSPSSSVPLYAQALAVPGAAMDPEQAGMLSRARFILPFTRRRSPPLTQLVTAPMASPVPLSDVSRTPTPPAPPPPVAHAVRLGVLIAMPQSSRGYVKENGPPVVEIGVAEAVVIDDRPQNDVS